MPQSFCTVCRRRIERGSRCAKHRIVSPSSKAWHERGAQRVRQQVIDRDKGCRLCGAVDELTVHHLVPARDAGPTTPNNLLVLCRDCHDAVERGELEIPGHIHQTDSPEGLRSPQVCAVDVTQRKEGPKWAS